MSIPEKIARFGWALLHGPAGYVRFARENFGADCGWMSDEAYARGLYRHYVRRKLDLDDPKRFSEKLQWLKLRYHDPRQTVLADKYRAKEVVRERIGAQYVVPTYGVWETPEQIDYDALPDQFVLKTNHDCGGVLICKDKSTFDRARAARFLRTHLDRDYSKISGEWPYRNIPRRIFAEKYLQNADGLDDYKFFCFNGEPRILRIVTDRAGAAHTGIHLTHVDMDFNRVDLEINGWKPSAEPVDRPEAFEEMKAVAAKMAEGFPFMRADLFCADGRIYVGEHTFFPGGGLYRFNPDEWDLTLGSWITLPEPVRAPEGWLD